MGEVKLKDVARAAGVSQGTASNVFNRPASVGRERRERVLAAAAALGYRGPQPAGRALRSGRTHLAALVVEERLRYLFDDPFCQRLLAGIGEVLDEVGTGLAVVSLASGRADGWSIETAIADGLILFCLEQESPLIARARARGVPFVAVDSGPVAGTATVNLDEARAAHAAAAHLAALGHRRVAILSLDLARDGRVGPVDLAREGAGGFTLPRERLAGYRSGLAAAGLDPAEIAVFETRNDAATVAAAIDHLFARAAPPTALLAMSDVIALDAIARLAERGLAVPGDVAVVGFDDVPPAASAVPALTTVHQPVEEKGRLAARLLLAGAAPGDVRLPGRLVVRASTGPPAAP